MPDQPIEINSKVVLSLTQIDDQLKVGLVFDPPLIMPDSPAYADLTPEQQNFQNYTAHIGNRILDTLQLDLADKTSEGVGNG